MRRAVLPVLTTLALVASLLAAVVVTAVVTAPAASAHVERPSYWPNPKADCSISPCAGGKVPTARTLRSALDPRKVGDTRVVCQRDSMRRVRQSVRRALAKGYHVRPTDHRRLSRKRARQLVAINERLFERCTYREIQPAVMASGNNDRVVVMPGLYLEPTARKQPTHDKACDTWHIAADDGDPGALSHDYQINCPNDANLIAVIGRGPDRKQPPSPPRTERHGIPFPGPCIRCNLQLEGSGVSADDVIIEAGDPKAGNGGPSAAGHKKDVGVFVDRADGFVMRGFTVRHAREHDIYVLETDGYLLEKFKAYYAGGYGVLTFTSDHGLAQHCDAAGHGDSGLYPGSGPDSTSNRYKRFYPKWRIAQTFRFCDSHHNTGGFSGTNSHGTRITRNNFYDNALGYTTDVFTAAGHPGFPQHGNVVDHNNFYDNNFNPYAAGSDVDPFIPAPVGTGLWLAGGNDNNVHSNRFYDNWRRGVMLFAVPDATVCGPPPIGTDTPVPGCSVTGTTTSHGNRFHGNTMGVAPGGKVLPNGTDFWWDSFPGNTGNCWWGNKAAPGARVTSSPLVLPGCSGGTAPATSIGIGDVVNEGELAGCLVGFQVEGYPDGSSTSCTWTTTPSRPAGRPAPLDLGLLATQAGLLGETCRADLSPLLCLGYPVPAGSDAALADRNLPAVRLDGFARSRPLSGVTCSWWRGADRREKVGMVQRIRAYAGGPINGRLGDLASFGHGATLSDTRALELFDGRCSTAHAGPFALYKLYGAAAPFAAFTG